MWELISRIEEACNTTGNDKVVYNALMRVLANFLVARHQCVECNAGDLIELAQMIERQQQAWPREIPMTITVTAEKTSLH